MAFPTDTVTGLGCRAGDARAAARIYALKGRARRKPLILFVSSLAAAERAAGPFSPRVRRLLRACWPGAFTAVLRARRRPPAGLTVGATLGIRVPAHPVALGLVRRAGPLATTSANRSGHPPVRDAAAAGAFWPGRVVAVPGASRGVPSTVADLTGWPPRILREGRLTARRLAALCRRAETLTRSVKRGG